MRVGPSPPGPATEIYAGRMGWATAHIAKLQNGETVQFRPLGNSMTGKISSGQLCTVIPLLDDDVLNKGEIVLCKVMGAQYLHLIKAIKGERYQIGNNRGGINGWIGRAAIFGKCVQVENYRGQSRFERRHRSRGASEELFGAPGASEIGHD